MNVLCLIHRRNTVNKLIAMPKLKNVVTIIIKNYAYFLYLFKDPDIIEIQLCIGFR